MAARFSLERKKCLVTGGTKGIGRAIVEELCELGAEVFICARSSDDVLEACAQLAAKGYTTHGCAADVTDREQCRHLVEQVSQAFHEELHVLVSNAGTNTQKALLDYDEQDYKRIAATNQEAAFVLCQLCQPLLATTRNASVVFVSSVAGGPLGGCSGAPYAMTKAAVNQLTKVLACEWAADGIRVNCAAPWVTLTEMGQQNLTDPARLHSLLARTPMGRLAEPSDVAGVVAFLCSPAAAYVTGQVIAVDGGYSSMGYWG